MEGFGAPSGLVVNIILSGEQARQEFQTFSNQMSEIMQNLKENIQSTNTVLKNMFNATKVNNFKKAVDEVNKSLREYNDLIANSPASKLTATPDAVETKAAAEKAAKTSGTMANTFFDTFKQQAGQIMNTSLTSHTIKGTQSIIRAFGTIASWIGRIRVITQSAVKVIFNLIKSPFTLISNLLGKVSDALGAVFKSFEWVQYQFFMQFMNIWLFAKTIVPILETFINYNREIYNTWAIAQEEWGQGLETIKQKLLDINDIELDTEFETLREDIEKNMGAIESLDLGKLLSDLGLSRAMKYGRMPQDVASAFYDMASATIEFNDVLTFTDYAIKASVAGVTDLTTAVESGIATVYAFGKEMDDLNKIYDYQFATVKYGIIRYEELAQVMGRVYAPAASLSDTFENMNEMYATMAFATRVGLSPEMSGFGLARLYESLSDSRVINNLKKLNVEVFDSIGNFRGLQAILGDLIVATKGFSTATTQAMLSSLGFDMRARRVMRSLMNNYGAYVSLLQEFSQTEELDNISGSMDEAFQKMQESFAFRIDQLKATWESLKITFSESILDTLVYYVDNIALAMRGLLGWLKEGTITIGDFSVSIGVLVKHLSLFYVLFAGVATLAGALKVATTPMGVFLGMFMALVNSAGKNGLMFTALAEKFEGLGAIIKTISDYIKIFFDLLKQDTPLKAFSTLLEMMFSDLGAILTSMPHINNVVEAFKKLFSAIQGLFDSSKYAQTMTDFFKETGKIPQNYGEVIAHRFGNIFNSIGKAIKQMLVDALGLELDDSQSILAIVIPKVYRLIMDVFAGIFGKETGTFGLKDLFVSIFETLGIVTRNSLGQAIVNRDFIRSIGQMFSSLLVESVKAALSNLPLFLTIAGFNISKEAFKSILMMFNNLPALLSQAGLGKSNFGKGITFAGDFLKFYAIIEFFDAMFGNDLLSGLPPLIQKAIKIAVAGSGAFIASMIRAGLQGKLIGKVLQDSLGRAFKAGVVTIYATVVNIYTSGLNQPQGLSSPITTTVMSTAKGSISAYLALAISAVAGMLGIAGLVSQTGEKAYTPATVRNISADALTDTLNKFSNEMANKTNTWAKVLGLGAAVALINPFTAAIVTPLLSAIGAMAASASSSGMLPKAGVATASYAALASGTLASPKVVPSLQALQLSEAIQEEYNKEVVERFRSAGLIRPELVDLVLSLFPEFLSKEKTAIQDIEIYKYAEEEAKAFVTLMNDFANVLLKEGIVDGTYTSFLEVLKGKTMPELVSYIDSYVDKYPSLLAGTSENLVRSLGSLGYDLQKPIVDQIEKIVDENIVTMQKVNEDLFIPFVFGLESLAKTYSASEVKKQFDLLDADIKNDPTAILDKLRSGLEASFVTASERVSMYKKINTLFISYFSDAIDALDVTNTDLVSGLKANTDIQSIYKNITGNELTIDTAVTLGELIDVLKKGSVSDVYDVRVKTAGILDELLASLVQYADEGDIENLTEFYNLLIEVKDYLDLAAGDISKNIYNLMQELDTKFMLPTVRGIKEINTIKDVMRTTQTENIFQDVEFWKALFRGNIEDFKDKLDSASYDILTNLLAENGGKLDIVMTMMYASMAEGIFETVTDKLSEIADSKDFIKNIGISSTIFDMDKGIFMKGTQYAKVFRDPVDTFSTYLLDVFMSLADESETAVNEFMQKNLGLGGVIGTALGEISEVDLTTAESRLEAKQAIEMLLNTTTDETVKKLMETVSDMMGTLDLYLTEPSKMAAFEALLGKEWKTKVEELKKRPEEFMLLLDIIDDVSSAMVEAGKNLETSMSRVGLAVSGRSEMAQFIELQSKIEAFTFVFGTLFGKQSIMGDMMNYLNMSTKFGIAELDAELKTLDLNDLETLMEFINANAQLLIDIGMISKESYINSIASGTFKDVEREKLTKDINENLIKTLNGYMAFMDFQSYFYREVVGKAEGNIMTMGLTDIVKKLSDIGTNIVKFITDVIFGQLFNPEKWAELAASGASLGSIIQSMSDNLFNNLESALYGSVEAYSNTVFDIFKMPDILPADRLLELGDGIRQNAKDMINISYDSYKEVAKNSMEKVKNNTGSVRLAMSSQKFAENLDIGNIVEASNVISMSEDEFNKFVEDSAKAMLSVEVKLQSEMISSLNSTLSKLIMKYIPKSVDILNKTLDIPLLGGALKLGADIISKFVSNYIFDYISNITQTTLLNTSLSLIKINKGVTGEEIFTNEEIVELSKSILLDGLNFVFDMLIISPLKMLFGELTFEDIIKGINVESVFKNTIGFIDSISALNTKLISTSIIDWVKNIEELKPLADILIKYEALDEQTEASATKLIEEQWGSIKKWVSDVTGIKMWLINILDIGIFRSGVTKLLTDLMVSSKNEAKQNDFMYGGLKEGIATDLSNMYASLNEGATSGLVNQYAVVNEELNKILFESIFSMKSLDDRRIKDELRTLVKRRVGEDMWDKLGIEAIISTLDIQSAVKSISEEFLKTVILETGETFSGVDIIAGVKSGLLSIKMPEVLPTSKEAFAAQIKKLAASLTEADVEILTKMQEENWKSTAMFFKPQVLKDMGIAIDESFINEKGDWVNISAQKAVLGRLTEGRLKELEEIYSEYIDTSLNSITNMSTAFGSMADSVEIIAEQWNIDSEIIVKGLKSAGVVVDGLVAGFAGFQAALEGKKLREGATDVIHSIIGGLGEAGGWAQVIAAVLGAFAGLIEIWKESHKLTESQLIAIRQNTVALESLTNILDSMRLTMYNAPSGFIYGYTNPTPVMPNEYDTTSTRGTVFNIEAININGVNGDPDEIAAAVEQGILLAAKRIR